MRSRAWGLGFRFGGSRAWGLGFRFGGCRTSKRSFEGIEPPDTAANAVLRTVLSGAGLLRKPEPLGVKRGFHRFSDSVSFGKLEGRTETSEPGVPHNSDLARRRHQPLRPKNRLGRLARRVLRMSIVHIIAHYRDIV